MKIKKISTEQFAGVRDREVTFNDGINVVYGKNESGKSTLVNLISRTLFQDADIGIKSISDKEFVSRYFPSNKKGVDIESDFIQGKVVFETEDGEYSIVKEWIAPEKSTKNNTSTCKLTTPEAIIKNQSDIMIELKKALRYGEVIYSEMLFSSQHNTDISLKGILDSSESTGAKKEIAEIVTKAFSESDGISAENIEKAIKSQKDLFAENWDFENGRPKVKKSGIGRWNIAASDEKDNKKRVLRAYYDLEDAEKNLKKMKDLEDAVESAFAHFRACDDEYNRLKEEHKNFSRYAGSIQALNQSEELKGNLIDQIKKYDNVATDWPKRANDYNKAIGLRNELENRKILDKYQEVKILRTKCEEAKTALSEIKNPSSEEINEAEGAKNEKIRLEASLCGMNLFAAIKMFGGNEIKITKVKTGDKIDISEGNCEIKEAVKIAVPGIMEMQLSPKGVDVAAVKDEIDRCNSVISGIFEKYEVNSIEELRKLQERYRKAHESFESAKRNLENSLSGETFDELEAKAAVLPETIRPEEEIEKDIFSLCEGNHIERFIDMNEAMLKRYIDDYGSVEKLQGEKAEKENKLTKVEEEIEMANNIPEEYRDINKLTVLEAQKDQAEKERDDAKDAKNSADSELNNFIEKCPDPVSTFEEAERVFNEQKELLKHWIHIEKVFNKVRENFRNNPMHDLAESFTNYLGIISGERISSEFPDEEKLEMEIYSGKNKLDYGKLSEGTKETVSLAFRLAVLDHLFPNGGGIIVFDDPFTDMDADRAAKSCELIKECAKKHQVIFLTCNEDYKETLGGKIIDI